MTREEAIKVLSSYDVNGVWADVDGKPYNAEEQAEAFDMAIEALEQEEPILDKIYTDIQRLRGCSCSWSDGIIDDVEGILDKYKAKIEPQESEE